MLYDDNVIGLQQKTNISSTRFPGLPTLVTEHAWYCGMSNSIHKLLVINSNIQF